MPQTSPAFDPDLLSTMRFALSLWTLRLIVSRWTHGHQRQRQRWLRGSSGRRTRALGTHSSSLQAVAEGMEPAL